MYCVNCGKELKENEVCNCTVGDDNKQATLSKKRKIVILVCCVCFLVVGIVYLVSRPEKIRLEDYLVENLSVTGSEGYATFSLHEVFDSDSFMKSVCGDFLGGFSDIGEYASEDELKKAFENMGVQLKAFDEVEQSIVLAIYVNGELCNEPSNLKNGDKVTIKVSSDIRTSKLLDKKFVSGSKEYKINGLKEAVVLSPFDEQYFSVKFSGVDGEGKIEWKISEEFVLADHINYEIVGGQYAQFSNGDKVTVQVTYDETYLSKEGYALSETSKQFTVEGLDRYINSLQDFPDKLLTKIKNDSYAKISNNPDADEYSNVVYQKIYFMNMKENADTSGFLLKQPQNRMLVVYTAKENFWGYDAYVCVEYSNITTDGTTIFFDGNEEEADAAIVNLYYESVFESSFKDYEQIYTIETVEQ